jgi:competence protein ComFC
MAVVLLSKALARARDWGECALNLAFPWPDSAEPEAKAVQAPFCRQCGYPYAELPDDGHAFACSTCKDRDWHFEWARAAFLTEGQVHEAVVGFKYRDEYYQLSRLVDCLTTAFDRHAIDITWNALVPVPLYHRRLRERGFNQAHELAHGLGLARKIAVSDCLYRYRETPSQTGLERGARWENMNGAFRLKAKFDVKGQNLLLIDDVFTTGATTNACARVLAKAGAGRLAVLTVSRS